MKIGIIKKDKTKIEIESKFGITILQTTKDGSIDIDYITDIKDNRYIWNYYGNIKKEDIQLIYFGGWNK